jgi:hypothetical protein
LDEWVSTIQSVRTETYEVEELAGLVSMSSSSFHRHFKEKRQNLSPVLSPQTSYITGAVLWVYGGAAMEDVGAIHFG